MTGVLAIETATEACSVALLTQGQRSQLHELQPRQHSQRLFGMLRELLPGADPRAHGVTLLAYGCGPGSFTGLRIAASAVQGLAFATGLSCAAVSTLACLAQTAVRTKSLAEGAIVVPLLDARIDEVYFSVHRLQADQLVEVQAPRVCMPRDIDMEIPDAGCHLVGSGCRYLENFPDPLCRSALSVDAELMPEAMDLEPFALQATRSNALQSAVEVQPIYVREEISWKKLPEQGRRR
jgi:tRNA threonylcarbamoyladenosine biosynthesis protein TsaB